MKKIQKKEKVNWIDEEILTIVFQHHERMDGRGYPNGLNKEEIHPFAKLVALCDVYDAIVHPRSYKEAKSHYFAIDEIKNGLGTQFDQKFGEYFLSFMHYKRLQQKHFIV